MTFQSTLRRTILVAFVMAFSAGLTAEEPAPQLTLEDIRGTLQSLSSLRGKITVLNFWATWCGPCVEEMPMLADVQKKYGERGVVVIGASLDDSSTRAKVEPFARKMKVNFAIWVGATTEDLKRLGLGEALPATAFLDREGHIVGRVLGMLRKRNLKHRLEWLLGNQQGAPPEPLVDNLNLPKKN